MEDDLGQGEGGDPARLDAAKVDIADARKAFDYVAEAESDNRKAYIDDLRFARLARQWPEEIERQRVVENRPVLTINRMPAFIRQVVNDARQNKPAIKVHPADSKADIETADIYNGLIRNIEYTSNADVAYDTAIESAAGKPFLEVLEEEIARPLGNVNLSADYQDRPVGDRASFYLRDAKGLRRWGRVNHSYKWAGGGLIASSSDLARIGSAWLDPDYISPSVRAAFWEPQRLVSGEVNPQNYAIGWRANANTGLLGIDHPVWNVHHGGVSKGAYSWLVIYPDLGVVVALNANARLDDFQDFIVIEQAITRSFVKGAQNGRE